MTPLLLALSLAAPVAPLRAARPVAAAPADPLAALRSWAVREELVGTEEARWLLERPRDLPAFLLVIHERRTRLACCPHLWELGRFPPREYVQAQWRFAHAFRAHCQQRIAEHDDQAGAWAMALAESTPLYAAWDALDDATCVGRDVADRREALGRLRRVLGEERWYKGEMPECVPVWRFARVE